MTVLLRASVVGFSSFCGTSSSALKSFRCLRIPLEQMVWIAFYYFHLCGVVLAPWFPTALLSTISHSAEFLFGCFPCQCMPLADIVKMNINVLVSWPFPAPCIQSWFVFMCIWVGAGDRGTEWMAFLRPGIDTDLIETSKVEILSEARHDFLSNCQPALFCQSGNS